MGQKQKFSIEEKLRAIEDYLRGKRSSQNLEFKVVIGFKYQFMESLFIHYY